MIMNTLKALAASILMATSACSDVPLLDENWSPTFIAGPVEYDEGSRTLTLSGITTQAQVNSTYRILSENEVLTVELSGPGGNYYAGLSLGRLLAEEGVTVIIREGQRCTSACAFAALGGEKVIVDGELLFHVPFLTAVPTNVSILEITQRFGSAYLDMPMYLADVGVTISFANVLMKGTSHCKFYVISDGAEVDKLKDIETPNQVVSVQYTVANNCGL